MWCNTTTQLVGLWADCPCNMSYASGVILYLSGELVATLGALEIPHAFMSPHVYTKLLDS